MQHYGPVSRQAPPEAAWDGRRVEACRGEVLGFYGHDARRDETGSVCVKAGIPISRMAENRMPEGRLRVTLLEGYQEAVLFSAGFPIRGKMLH